MQKVNTYDVIENRSSLTPLVVRYERVNGILMYVQVAQMYQDQYDHAISYGTKDEVVTELESLIECLIMAKNNLKDME